MNSVDFRFGCVRFALAAAVSALAPGRADAAEVAPAKGARAPLTALLPAGPGAVELLQARLDAGWLSFKWKVGVEPIDRELGLLDELLAVLPDHARLRLDANGAWDRRQATRWLQRCADRPIEFVEQPVAPADRAALFGLAADFPVKLALDESVVRLDEARRWQAEGWTGVFVIKPALAGPLDELSAWVEQTRADVVISSAIETALARAAIVHHALRHPALFARAPGLGIGEVFGDRRFDGPITGPVIDRSWAEQVNPAEIWEAMGRTET